MWHLAVATLSFDDALEGPTAAAMLQHQGIIIKTSNDLVDLCDDGFIELCNMTH